MIALSPFDDGVYWTGHALGNTWQKHRRAPLQFSGMGPEAWMAEQKTIHRAIKSQRASACNEDESSDLSLKEPATSDCSKILSGSNPSYPVIVHSPPKAATTVIGSFLRKLGYKPRMYCGVNFERRMTAPIRAVNALVANSSSFELSKLPNQSTFLSSHWDVRGLLHHSKNFGCYSDTPYGHVIQEEGPGLDLRAKLVLWPHARFIWSDRPIQDAALSWCRWKHGGREGKANESTAVCHDKSDAVQRNLAEIAKARTLAMLLRAQNADRVHIVRWRGQLPCKGAARNLVAFLMGKRCARLLSERGYDLEDPREAQRAIGKKMLP